MSLVASATANKVLVMSLEFAYTEVRLMKASISWLQGLGGRYLAERFGSFAFGCEFQYTHAV
jgi:hypothetical protein